MGSSRLYEEDFYAWANEQAGLLRVLPRPRLVRSKSAMTVLGRASRPGI